jgi:hypothetical protein
MSLFIFFIFFISNRFFECNFVQLPNVGNICLFQVHVKHRRWVRDTTLLLTRERTQRRDMPSHETQCFPRTRDVLVAP